MSKVTFDSTADRVLNALRDGKRLDGRGFEDYREISVEKHISENAEGSARVRLGQTEVVVGVKMIPGTPYPDSPDLGTISVGADLLPLADPEWEARPPSPQAIEVARVVDRGIRESKCLDFKKLCIREGELVWVVFIDGYVMNFDGNMFDALSLASLAALNESKTPKLEDDKVVKGEFTGKLGVERQPIMSTFAKIGKYIVVDPDLSEERAADARFSVSTTEDDYICACQKGGNGSFTVDELTHCIETAFAKAKELRKKV